MTETEFATVSDATGKLQSDKSNSPSSSSTTNRTWAPLNIPWHRRCETLTIVAWWLTPWFCLYLSIAFLRSDRWYLSWGMLLYIAWMIVFRKFPKEGGHRQQWLRRSFWWKWYTSEYKIVSLDLTLIVFIFKTIFQFVYIKHVIYLLIVLIYLVVIHMVLFLWAISVILLLKVLVSKNYSLVLIFVFLCFMQTLIFHFMIYF